jgi:hypothetical protein
MGIDLYRNDTKTGALLNAVAHLAWTDSPHPLAVVLAVALQRDDMLDAMGTPTSIRDSACRIVKRTVAYGLFDPDLFATSHAERIVRCAARHGACGRALALDILSILVP